MKIRRKMYYRPADPRRDPLDWEFDGATLSIVSAGEAPVCLGKCCREWTGFRDRIRFVSLGEGITKIDHGYFEECSCLEEVKLPVSLREVGRYAFFRCESLRRVHFPGACTEIGEGAFAGCSRLEEAVLSPDLSEIGMRAFMNCTALREVHLPGALTTMLPEAFKGCRSLREIRIPGSLKEVLPGAFGDCTALESVILEEGIAGIQGGFTGCEALTEIRMPETVTYVHPRAFSGTGVLQPMGRHRGLTDRGTLYHLEGPHQDVLFLPPGIRRVAGGALSGVCAECVVIPDTVERLEPYALQDVRADVIYLGTGVRELPKGVLSGCREVSRLYIAGTLRGAAANLCPESRELEVISVPENRQILTQSMGEAHEAAESCFPWDPEDEEEDSGSLTYREAADAGEIFRWFCREEENLLRRVYQAPACALPF